MGLLFRTLAIRPIVFTALLAVVGATAQPAVTGDGQTAAQYAESLYPKGGEPGSGAVYTPRIKQLWARCAAREKKTGNPCMDVNMFVNAQDFDISGVSATQIGVLGNDATVVVAFKNMGKPTRIVLDLERIETGAWLIADIRSENRRCATLSGILQGKNFPC